MRIEATVNLTRYKTLDKLGTDERVETITEVGDLIIILLSEGFVSKEGSRNIKEYTVRAVLKQMRMVREIK